MIKTYFKFHLLDTMRTPIMFLAPAFFPALALLFFVLPQKALVTDPVAATSAITQMLLFAVISVYIFQYGVGIAEERTGAWHTYRRSLPVGPIPDFLGRLLMSIVICLFSFIPVTLLGAFFTEAKVSLTGFFLGVLVVLLSGLPFLGLGLAIGYLMRPNPAVAVAQLVVFPMAFLGGLFLPPQMLPDWLNTISLGTVARSARDLLIQVTTGQPAPASTVWVFLAWTVAALAFAWWAYRRDEGKNYR